MVLDSEDIIRNISDSLASTFILENNSSNSYRGWKENINLYSFISHIESNLDVYAINLNEYKKYKHNLIDDTEFIKVILSNFYQTNIGNIYNINFWEVFVPQLFSVTGKDEQYIIFCIIYRTFTHYDTKKFDDEFSVVLNKWNPFKKTKHISFYKRLLSLKRQNKKYTITKTTNEDEYLISYYKNQIKEKPNYDLTIRQFLTLWKSAENYNCTFINTNDITYEMNHTLNVLNHYTFNSYLHTEHFHHYPTYVIWKEKHNSKLGSSLFVPLTLYATEDEIQKIEDRYEGKEENTSDNISIGDILSDDSLTENVLNNLSESNLSESNLQENDIQVNHNPQALMLTTSQAFMPSNLSLNILGYAGKWKSDSFYDVGDVVINTEYNVFFLCTIAHLSNSFSVDYLVNNYWEQIINEENINHIKVQQEIVEKNKKSKKEKKKKDKKKSRKVFVFDEHK